jgi:PAP2 superfamily
MTQKISSFKMRVLAFIFLLAATFIFSLSACKKRDDDDNKNNHVSVYSANVLDKWMTIELRLMRNATGIPNHPFSRHFAYAGIAALESVAPGLPPQERWSKKWNGLTGLPPAEHCSRYYYPANVNAAMASILKAFFPSANEADKLAIDSLENALKQEFLSTQKQSVVESSATFGKGVATAVFNWAETDGYKNASGAYTPPVGDGLWVPTPPAFATPVTPFWGNNREIIKGSTDNTQPPAPLSYSTDASSPFYQMVKQVYDASQNLTDEQRTIAFFWRDIPGVSSPGHWLSIVQQVVRQKKAALDKAILAFALTGTACNDAFISCFQTKYRYNLLRPVTYIQNVLGYKTWSPLFPTPAHPEYTSAHAVLSASSAEVLQRLFGSIGSFTDHTYDNMGFAPRTYSSFEAIVREAGISRFYAGIHYQLSVDVGQMQGKKVALNILNKNHMPD